jgi:hypothetical protein
MQRQFAEPLDTTEAHASRAAAVYIDVTDAIDEDIYSVLEWTCTITWTQDKKTVQSFDGSKVREIFNSTVCIVCRPDLLPTAIKNLDFGYPMNDQFVQGGNMILIEGTRCVLFYYRGLAPFEGAMSLEVSL